METTLQPSCDLPLGDCRNLLCAVLSHPWIVDAQAVPEPLAHLLLGLDGIEDGTKLPQEPLAQQMERHLIMLTQ